MSRNIDPQVVKLRGALGAAIRDGREADAAENRRQLASILALRSLREVAPTLTQAERAEYAAVLFSADGAA